MENKPVSNKPKSVKLSYKEQRELEQLPQLLEDLEEKITALQTEIGRPEFLPTIPRHHRCQTESVG